jgi:peptidoglycan/LPS O-acetylase OafA/YrhL
MVPIFFTLSGFVIYRSYSNNLKNIKDVLRFQFLRFGRLYPVHITFLTVFILIELAKWLVSSELGILSPNSQPFHENNITAIFENIFLVQAFVPKNIHTFNGPSWSISTEFYTYFLFALAMLYSGKYKFYVFLSLCFGSILLIVSDYDYGYGELLSCFFGFFLGCIVAYFEEKVQITLPKYLSLVVFIVIVFFLIFKSDRSYDPAINFLAAILLLALTVTKNGYLNKVFRFKLFIWLGTISYSIYMSHLSVIWIANQFIRVILKKSEIIINGQSIPHLTNFETFVAVTSVITIVILVSTLVNKFIENPFRLKSRRYAHNKIK